MTVAPSFARRSSDGVKKAELLSLRKCEIASHRNWSAIMKMMFGGALVDGGGDGFALADGCIVRRTTNAKRATLVMFNHFLCTFWENGTIAQKNYTKKNEKLRVEKGDLQKFTIYHLPTPLPPYSDLF